MFSGVGHVASRLQRLAMSLQVAFLGAAAFALLAITLELAYYAQAKAFYVLSAVVPLALVGGLGLIAGTAWFTGLAVMLSETTLGDSAPLVTAAIAVVYLIVSSSAMLPLLLHSARQKREEVRA